MENGPRHHTIARESPGRAAGGDWVPQSHTANANFRNIDGKNHINQTNRSYHKRDHNEYHILETGQRHHTIARESPGRAAGGIAYRSAIQRTLTFAILIGKITSTYPTVPLINAITMNIISWKTDHAITQSHAKAQAAPLGGIVYRSAIQRTLTFAILIGKITSTYRTVPLINAFTMNIISRKTGHGIIQAHAKAQAAPLGGIVYRSAIQRTLTFAILIGKITSTYRTVPLINAFTMNIISRKTGHGIIQAHAKAQAAPLGGIVYRSAIQRTLTFAILIGKI